MKLCPICRGRGEVSACITIGVKEHFGSAEPTAYHVNPSAWDKRISDVWLLETNPFGKLFGIAICVECHGTGFLK